MRWRVKVETESLLIEHDDALYTEYMSLLGDRLCQLQDQFEKEPMSNLQHRWLEEIINLAIEGEAITLLGLQKDVKALPDNLWAETCHRILERILDDFTRAFNHLVVLRRYMIMASKDANDPRPDGATNRFSKQCTCKEFLSTPAHQRGCWGVTGL